MSRSRRDEARDTRPEPINYTTLAKHSPTLDDYRRELAKRNVTAEASKEWQKAMTAWKAVEASRGKTPHKRTQHTAAAGKGVDYAALAGEFRHRKDYERHLVRELGLKPGTNEWKNATEGYDLKEHLEAQQRRPDRAPHRDLDDRRAIERAEDRLIQVAREARTREEFDRYLREELHYEPGSVKYETAMLAWAVFKRETEGF